MIGAIVAAALQSSLVAGPVTCDVTIDLGPRRVDSIDLACPDVPESDALSREVRRQILELDIPLLPPEIRYTPVQTDVTAFLVDNADELRWHLTTISVTRAFPEFPFLQARAGRNANCVAAFNIVDGQVEPVTAHCASDGDVAAFEQSVTDTLVEWIFTAGLPAYCVETGLTFATGGLDDPALEPPARSACSPPEGYESSYPAAVRPFLPLMNVPYRRVSEPEYDRRAREAECTLHRRAAGNRFRIHAVCPDGAPEAADLTRRINAMLHAIGPLEMQGDDWALASHLHAEFERETGWHIPPDQLVYSRAPTLIQAMFDRRSSATCRAGVMTEDNGRARSFDVQCATSIAPGRVPGIVTHIHGDMQDRLSSAIWLPVQPGTCFIHETEYEIHDSILDRGIPGTDPDDLPDFCEGERDE